MWVSDVHVRIGGDLLGEGHQRALARVEVQRVESGIGAAYVDLLRQAGAWGEERWLQGAAVQIAFQIDAGARVEVFDGEIVAAGILAGREGPSLTRIRCAERLHRLGRAQRQRVHQGVTEGELLSILADECGLSASSELGGAERPWVVQAGISDLELLTQRADRYGYCLWTEGETVRAATARPVAARHTLKVEEEISALRVVRSLARVSAGAQARGWDEVGDREQVGEAPAGGERRVETQGRAASALVDAEGQAQIWSHPVRSEGEAAVMAEAFRLRSSLEFAALELEMPGRPEVAPGDVLTLERAPSVAQGAWRVVKVRHVRDASGMITALEARRNSEV